MSTAIVAISSITPSLTTGIRSRAATRQIRSQAKTIRLIDVWREAKAKADGAIVFLIFDESVAVFNEDADLLTEALGMFPREEEISGERACVEFRRSHFEMYVRLLRSAGHGDIWSLDQKGRLWPTDEDGLGVNKTYFQESACRFVLEGRIN